MDIEKSIKYLDFVVNECDKILEDRSVTGKELIHLITEIQLFKNRVIESELAEELKREISCFKLNYSVEGVEKVEKYRMIGYILLRGFSRLIERKMMKERMKAVYKIRENCTRLSFYIKSNY